MFPSAFHFNGNGLNRKDTVLDLDSQIIITVVICGTG